MDLKKQVAEHRVFQKSSQGPNYNLNRTHNLHIWEGTPAPKSYALPVSVT